MIENKLEWSSKEKEEARKHICRKRSNSSFHHVLLLPSDTALDAKELMKSGAIRKGYTRITAVERDPKRIPELTKNLKALEVPFSIIKKDLTKITLEELKKLPRIDFMYLDTCCFLTEEMLNWLIMLRENHFAILSDRAILVTAFCHFNRHAHEVMTDFNEFAKKDLKFNFFVPASKTKLNTLEIGEFNKDTEFRHKSFRAMRNMLFCLFNWQKEAIQYKNEDSTTVMTTFEHLIVNQALTKADTSALKFLKSFLDFRKEKIEAKRSKEDSSEAKQVKKKLKEVEEKAKAAKAKVKELEARKAEIVTYDKQKKLKEATLEVKFKRCLAGWRAAASRKKQDPQERVMLGLFEFVQGLPPEEMQEVVNIFNKEFTLKIPDLDVKLSIDPKLNTILFPGASTSGAMNYYGNNKEAREEASAKVRKLTEESKTIAEIIREDQEKEASLTQKSKVIIGIGQLARANKQITARNLAAVTGLHQSIIYTHRDLWKAFAPKNPGGFNASIFSHLNKGFSAEEIIDRLPDCSPEYIYKLCKRKVDSNMTLV